MSLLDQIQTGTEARPRRTWIYGTHGIGKSTFGARAENPIFVPTEDGLGEIDCARFPLIKTFEAAIEALSALYAEKHTYRTVVIDSLDWLEKLIWIRVCRDHGLQNLEEMGYGKGYVLAMNFWRDFLEGLTALRNDRDMNILLISHSKIERFENPATESYDRYTPRLHKLASAYVQEWCDEVMFASYQVHTRQLKEKFDRKRTQAIGDGVRILKTKEKPSHVAKSRLALPDEMPLDWSEYAQYFTHNKPKPQPKNKETK